MKDKNFHVVWEQKHVLRVKAKNEEEAIKKVIEGQGFVYDIEVSDSPQAYEVKEEKGRNKKITK